MKNKWLILSKIFLLLVCFGFFMPVSCDLNGADLAKMFNKMDSVGYAILIWIVFISALISIIITVFFKDKTDKEPIILDWILLLGSISSGSISTGKILNMNREYFNLQFGAYIIVAGWILSFIFLIVASLSKNKIQTVQTATPTVFSQTEEISKKENEALKNAISIKTTPGFWVYENWWNPEDKSVIHRAGCPVCNNGKGSKEIKQGIWHGQFATYDEAKTEAAKLNRKENLECKVCNPSQNSN